ncbi:MAG: hypothetical protein ACE5KM_06765 [Planctomycetaceae bacterium]
MKSSGTFLSIALSMALPFALTGCGETDGKTNGKTDNKTGGHDEHPSKGPHGGHTVDLGDHEYHAEVVHDEENDTVTVYILSTANKPVPIDAKEVVINLKHDGMREQFKLPAVRDEGDPENKSSRFQLKNKELHHDLEANGAEPKLSVKIKGRSYTAEIKHDHEEGKHKH